MQRKEKDAVAFTCIRAIGSVHPPSNGQYLPISIIGNAPAQSKSRPINTPRERKPAERERERVDRSKSISSTSDGMILAMVVLLVLGFYVWLVQFRSLTQWICWPIHLRFLWGDERLLIYLFIILILTSRYFGGFCRKRLDFGQGNSFCHDIWRCY